MIAARSAGDDLLFHYTPFDEVIDFLKENENFFPGLEEATATACDATADEDGAS